jgi:uncharacterized protein (TIGR02300 family)
MSKIKASAGVPDKRGIALTALMARGKGARFRHQPDVLRSPPLANPELGTKQICPICQAKFYDLGKRPAHCPKCAAEFDPDEAVRNRRVRARATTPEFEADEERPDQVRGGEAEGEEEEEEEVVAPELDEVADEPLAAEDEDEGEAGAGSGGDDLAEFQEDEDVDEGDDVPFLEEDEDDFDDSEIDGLPEEGDED